jgi:UDP-N-acetylmuramyl pentapeptide phosphotransferase/UDP-N-acetylglucosamine-1-phosphate transferase
MENPVVVSPSVSPEGEVTESQFQEVQSNSPRQLLKKLKGGLFFVVGYLLSPLCWWNDLVFNLPIAYFFGYLCSWFSPNLFLPCAIAGYWLSNIVGILLMQMGALDVFQGQSKQRNLKKELITGIVSSTVYTLVILALVQLKVLDTPDLFAGDGSIHFSSFLPGLTNR